VSTPEHIPPEEIFNDNMDAVALWDQVYAISHAWDDLIDQDKPLSRKELQDHHCRMLIDLPMNPFYQKHFAMLQPVMISGLMAYRASVTMEEAGGDHNLELAHYLRYEAGQIIIMACYLCGGPDHVDKYAPYLYRRIFNERLTDYLTEQRGQPA